MNGVQTRFKCKLDVKRCKRFVFPPSSLLPRSNALKTKAIRYFQTDRTLTRIVSPPLNKAEADLLLSELKIYINRISGNRILEEKIDFGIISPYKAQVQYLRNKIKADASLKPYRSLFTVNTVDGFQGQERDVIFISLVRANEEGQIGFLNDLRRMNVAITRARMKLVILGEAETLKHHGFYRKLLEFIQNIGNQ